MTQSIKAFDEFTILTYTYQVYTKENTASELDE
jgi:hypothetical protein